LRASQRPHGPLNLRRPASANHSPGDGTRLDQAGARAMGTFRAVKMPAVIAQQTAEPLPLHREMPVPLQLS
jgi:hypothetical protein